MSSKQQDNNYGPADTTVSTSKNGSILMAEATSSSPNLEHVSPESEFQPEVDYQQPTSISNLGNSPSKSQISDEQLADSESNISTSMNKKINAHFCEFFDQAKGQCKQRAINNYKFCIRHILLDTNAPYKQCQHQRKPKNKQEKSILCTNAIRASCPEIYCSTHLIMNGLKDPKISQKKENKSNPKGSTAREKTLRNEEPESQQFSQQHMIATHVSNEKHLAQYSLHSDNQQSHYGYGGQFSHLPGGDSRIALTQTTPLSTLVKVKNNWNLIPQNQNEFATNQLINFSDRRQDAKTEGEKAHHKSSDIWHYEHTIEFQNKDDHFVATSQHRDEKSENMPIGNLSKNYPQLAAKLLQSKAYQRSETMASHEGSESLVNSKNEPMLPSSSTQSMTKFVHPASTFDQFENVSAARHSQITKYLATHKNQNIKTEVLSGIPHVITNHKEFVQPYFSYMASSLTFLNKNPPPRHYNIDKLESKINNITPSNETSLGYKRESEDIEEKLTGSPIRKRQQKVIKLRQKRQKVRIDGAFRSIPMVDSMCRIVESQDFDRTDLFPLGLEPSDDESSDDSFPSLGEEGLGYSTLNQSSNGRVELYLLKKQLRLESSRLVQRAKLCVPINTAAKSYKNSVGAALRVRKSNRKRENLIGEGHQNRLSRCIFTSQQQVANETKSEIATVRCPNPPLPWARHCLEHITSNVSQKLFHNCKWRLCNSPPMASSDLILFDGFCRKHYAQHRKGMGQTHQYQSSARPSQLLARVEIGSTPRKEEGQHQQYRSCESLATSSRYDKFESSSSIHYGQNIGPLNREEHEHLDVSLASVAKDLGFDGRELTDMLAKLPVEEDFEGDIEPDDDNLLTDINKDDSDEAPPGVALGHSWADVEQFLLEQEEGLLQHLPGHSRR